MSAHRAPKVMYWVHFDANDSKKVNLGGYGRHWAANKGGKFSRLNAAKDRVRALRREWPDAIVELYATDLSWIKIKEDE